MPTLTPPDWERMTRDDWLKLAARLFWPVVFVVAGVVYVLEKVF